MDKLLREYKEISLLGKIGALLGWDTEVNLPPKGAPIRGEQSALLTSFVFDKWNKPQFKILLETANKEKNLSLKEKAILRNLNRSAKVYYKIPKKLLVKESELTSKAFVIWAKARKENHFKDFAPILGELLNISLEVTGHLGYKKNPYNALLDLYEPGLTVTFCQDLFDRLVPELSMIAKGIKPKGKMKFKFPVEKQKELVRYVLIEMGYDFEAGRIDLAPHPFETSLGHFDVRITNRYKENTLEGLTGAMHEGGHALYEQGVDPKFETTPLDHGVSLGIHESQSRFWENVIGRSRAFAEFVAPKVKILKSQQIYDILNQVKPGPIRVDADEVTYNLHIALRFEIENALLNRKIKVKDLPEVWNSLMKKYLGVIPNTDSDGVLQDVHWSGNSFGYFPTYTLGNLYAAQWRYYMNKDLNIEKSVIEGNFKLILRWLRKNIHQYGSLYYPDELVKRVTHEKLNPQYFLDYIKEKYQTD